MRETRLGRDDLMDILLGCAVLGTGGGGDLDEGIGLIDAALAAGKTFDLVSLDDVPDDAVLCTPYMLGAISEMPADEQAAYARLPRIGHEPILLAYDRAQAQLGTPFFGAVPCELGGSNTAVAFFAAAMSGHKIVDADPAGRAVPEITHSTYYLAGLPAAPIVCATVFGEVMTLEHVHDDLRAETLVRALSMVSRNDIAAVDHALPARDLKSALIPGTLSTALAMGRALRAAQATGADGAEAVASAGGGAVVFRGTMTTSHWRTEHGFTLGEIGIEGDAGHYRIALKNENLAGWHNGAVHATIPDLICVIDLDARAPVTNPDARIGQSVAVVVLPAPAAFCTAQGLAAFGPAYAGLPGPFRSPLAPKD